MEQVRKILINNLDKYKHLDYYEVVIEEIERHEIEKPDISIESCKSLIEGISKIILKKLDKSMNDKSINKLECHDIFKKAMTKLSEYDKEFELDFINRSGSLVHLLCEIRNGRGDISHGRIAPKEETSSNEFSKLVLRVTDALLSYILVHFFDIDVFDEVKYEDNPKFNDKLDLECELDGKLRYSLALYNQDPICYFDRLETFLDRE